MDLSNETEVVGQRPLWERVLVRHAVPPVDHPQPSEAQRQRLVAWIDAAVFQMDAGRPHPGPRTIGRLNRAEYRNTIRDLVGVDFDPSESFPVDPSGHGFDNMADVLNMPPILLEKYLEAAEQIARAAMRRLKVGLDPRKAAQWKTGEEQKGTILIEWMELEGPEHLTDADLPAAHRRIFAPAKGIEDAELALRRIIERLAPRAFRRPAVPQEVDRLATFGHTLLDQGLSVEEAVEGVGYDAWTVDEIVRRVKSEDYRFSSLVIGIVESKPFCDPAER